jgi:hypothetical protein
MSTTTLPKKSVTAARNNTFTKRSFKLLTLVFLMLGINGWGQNFTDNASNYSSWTNGSNLGSGFGVWTLSAGANSGSFLGNPANNGMATTGIGTNAFGLFATGSAYMNATRPFAAAMEVGDKFTFYWAINWDANGGGKGFDFKNGSTTIFTVINSGSSAITAGGVTADANFGTTPMLVTLIRTSSTQYSFSMTSRSGGSTYNSTINSSSAINAINFFIGNQNEGNGNRNMYFNHLSIEKGRYRSKVSGAWNNASTWQVSTDGGSTWSDANAAPSSANGPITILNTHEVTVSTTITIDQTTINSGGKVILATGGAITVANGPDANDLVIDGTYERQATTTTLTPTGAVFCGSGGVYIHNAAGGTVPTITWDSNSTLQIDANLASDEFTEIFGNVTVNNSAAFFISTTSATYTGSIAGNFTHNSSGAISLKNTSFDATLTIGGNLTITGGGTFRIMEGIGTSLTKSHKLIVNGNFSLSNGTLNLSNETGASSSASALLEVKGNFTHTGGTISETATSASLVTRISLIGTAGTQTLESTGQTGTVNFVVAGSNAQCVVAASKTFVLGAGGMTVSAGTATPDLSVNGILRNSGGVITTTGTATFNSTGTYEHNFTTTAGVIPTATWSSGSTCAIVGYTSFAGSANTSMNQTFSNFTWNCPNQTTTCNIQLNNITPPVINGNFTVLGTGSGVLRLASSTTYSLTIGGDLIISSSSSANVSTLNLSNGSAATIGIAGNMSVTQSGTGVASLTLGTGSATINLNKSTGIQTISSSGTISGNINWNVGTGTSTNTLQLASNVNLGTGTGTFTVLANATFDAGTNVLSGSAASTINSGGSVITANSGGVNGSITLSGTRTYNAAANYTFNGSAAQVTGAALAAANNVTINNSAGVTLSTNTAVTGTLTFTNGNLTTNGNTLTLSNSPSGATASRYIIADATGTVTMNSVSTAKTLPIGTATAYAPLTVTAGSATNYTATVSSILPCSATDATRVVNLAWTLNGSNAPSSVVFQWPAASQAGSFNPASSCDLGRYNTTCPYNVSTIGTPSGTGPYTLTASSGLTSGNQQYVIGNADAVYLNPPTIAITVAPSSITHNTASSGGQTLTGNSITAKGVAWDTSTAPTVALSTKTNDGTGASNFSSSLTSLAAQTLYYMRAYATNATATAYGDEKTFRTLSSPATAQATGFSATETSSSNIDLSWTGATFPGSGATASGYILLRATQPNTPSLGSSNGAAPISGANTTIVSSTIANTATNFSNSGLASSTQYNYLLIPYTWDGTNATTYNYLTASAPTANATTQSGTTPPVLTTSAASSVTASSATLNGEITADGGGSVTARGFVYSSSDTTPTLGEGGVTDQASGTGTGTFNASVSSLTPNTIYYYQAYATNSSGTSYGGIITFTTPKAEPTAQPTALVFSSVTTTSFNTAFTAASGSPDGYIVVRSTSASLSADPVDGTTYTAGNSLGGGTIVSVGTTISGIANSSLTAGTTYYTFVFAYNNSGATIDYLTASPLSSSVTTITAAPTAPSFSSITTTGATVSWSAVTGADSYRLDISTVSNFASFVSGYNDLTVTGTSQALTGLIPNTTYFARIRAVNASGTSSSSSNGSSATLHNAPTVAAGSGATTSAITANWTAPTGGGGVTFTYTVELSTNAVDFSTLAGSQSNIASGTLTATFTGLSEGTTYFFRVKSDNATGSSAWSAVSSGITTLTSSLGINVLGTAVTENFNTLASSGTATGTPQGWYFSESGTGANTSLTANSGTATAGDTYSFGTTSDRAFGSLRSGSVISTIGAKVQNNSGSTINNLEISFTGEQWRLGATGRVDRLDFQYSLDATSLTTGTWTDVNSLDFTAPTTSGTVGALDGNASANRTAVSFTITGLTIADGANFYIRWNDLDATGADDGLAIDDFSIKGCGTISAPTAENQTFCASASATVASLVATGTSVKWYAASSGGTALSTATALVNNTIYYASQTVDGCESISRTAVTVTITNTPSAPTGTATQVFCTSDSPTVANLAATGSSIQWYAASSGGSPLSTSTALVNNTIYYASQTFSGCESTTRFAVTASLVINGTWLGTTSTDWNTASNWCGGVPTSSTNVVINSGASNYPDLSTGADGVANSITINSGGSFIMGGSEMLTITSGGSFNNNGTFTAGASTRVVFAGTGSITGTVAFNNVTTSGTLTPSTTTTINGTLTLNSGGSIATNSPIFGASSTLQYNFGGGFGARRNQALEWPASNGPSNLILTNGSWIQLTGNRNLSGNATITNGALQASGARNLTMNGTTQTITVSSTSGGGIFGTDNGFGNDLSLVIANGSTTTLTGDATSSGDDEKKFLNVTVDAGGTLALSRGILCKYGTFTVNGTLRINSNGYVQSTNGIAPTYGGSATLIYNTGGSYGRGIEWSTTSGAGYPNNVQVSNSTTLNVRNGADVARQMAGNLTVDAGSTLSMEGMTSGSFEIGLNVLGNISNSGTITLATSTERVRCANYINNAGGTTTLSSNIGGDLELTGNLVDNANFISNNRAVFFTGTGTQDVSGSGVFNIDYVVSNKASGSIRLLSNLLVEGPNGGNAVTLTNSTDKLDLNGNTLTIGGTSVSSTITGNGFFIGSSSSSLSILGTGSFGTIRFDQTSLGSSNALNNFTINRTASGSVTLANPISVSGTLTITNGNLNLGTNRHTANALTLGSTAQTSSSSYGGTGSPAENINTTYFAATTGYVNVGSCTDYSLTATTATACLGSPATVTLTNTTAAQLPVGTYTVLYTLTGANTGSGSGTMVVSTAGTGTFSTTNISNSGATTITINFIRNGCVSAISANNTAAITINAVQSASVSIASNDVDNTICAGTSVTFTATPTNGGTTPSYQWKLNGTDVGTDSATFTTSALANGDVVTVVMTSNASPCLTGSPATSNAITTTVNANQPASVSIASSDADNTICAGTSVTFTATPTNGGTTPSYQWKLNSTDVGTDSATFITSALVNGDVVTVVMTSNASPCLTGSPATSNAITTTVNANQPASVSIASSDADNTICTGTSVTFTATPTNGGTTPSYQWKLNGTNVGTDSATYTTSGLVNGDAVTVVMTSNASPCLTGSPVTSNGITTTVVAEPSGSISSTNGGNQCPGSNVSFTISGTANAVVSYQLNGGATQTINLTGGIATITVNNATSTQELTLLSIDNGSCVVPLTDSESIVIETTTWNGTQWSHGLPSATKAVIIAGNYTATTNLDACSLVVNNNAAVVIPAGFNVHLSGALSVATGSTFTLNSNANLLQDDASAVNTGNIIVRRATNPLIRLDYVMWSSPVAAQNLLSFSPQTSVNPTIRFYTYNTSANFFNQVTDFATHPMVLGKGYLIRLPFNHPTAPATWTGSFTGVPNNGTQNITMANVAAGQRYNFVGNPYPSTLSMTDFYNDNSNAVEPTVYFWRKTNGTQNPTYCTYNLSTDTFTDNGQPFTEDPNGVIQVGQGFIVEAKDAATTLTFNNGQRIANNANQTFRTATASQSIERHRVWLNLTGTAGEFSQMMVGYFTDGTLGLDGTDSKYFNDGTTELTSPVNGVACIMNGRPVPFDAADVVPLTYKVATAGTFSVAIDRKDGLFDSTTQPIYVHDLATGAYHNLNDGPYTFTTAVGTFNNRLELVYQNALSTENPTLNPNSFTVVKNPTQVQVSATESIATVRVYDLRGRLIVQQSGVNATQVSLPVEGDQVLLVQVTTISGLTGVKKVL